MANKKVVVLLSGGADSVAAYLKLREQGYEVEGLFFNYDQPSAEVEKELALKLVVGFGKTLWVQKLDSLKAMKQGVESDEQAFVPHRNTIFMLHAANFAESIGFDNISIGYMKNDISFFDNSVEHHRLIEKIITKNIGREFKVLLPLIDLNKIGVMEYLKDKKVETTSCWNATFVVGSNGVRDKLQVCGKCANCKERKLAEDTIKSVEGK